MKVASSEFLHCTAVNPARGYAIYNAACLANTVVQECSFQGSGVPFQDTSFLRVRWSQMKLSHLYRRFFNGLDDLSVFWEVVQKAVRIIPKWIWKRPCNSFNVTLRTDVPWSWCDASSKNFQACIAVKTAFRTLCVQYTRYEILVFVRHTSFRYSFYLLSSSSQSRECTAELLKLNPSIRGCWVFYKNWLFLDFCIFLLSPCDHLKSKGMFVVLILLAGLFSQARLLRSISVQ